LSVVARGAGRAEVSARRHGSISGDAAATCGVYRTDALRLLVETTSQPPLQAMSSLPRLMKNSGLTTSDVAVAVTSSTARSDRGPLGANLLLDELPPAGGRSLPGPGMSHTPAPHSQISKAYKHATSAPHPRIPTVGTPTRQGGKEKGLFRADSNE
jgi:hypothetical protein